MLDLQATSSSGVMTKEVLSTRDAAQSLASGIQVAVEHHNRAADVISRVEAHSIIASPGDVSLIAEELVDNACKFSLKGDGN